MLVEERLRQWLAEPGVLEDCFEDVTRSSYVSVRCQGVRNGGGWRPTPTLSGFRGKSGGRLRRVSATKSARTTVGRRADYTDGRDARQECGGPLSRGYPCAGNRVQAVWDRRLVEGPSFGLIGILLGAGGIRGSGNLPVDIRRSMAAGLECAPSSPVVPRRAQLRCDSNLG